MKKMLSLAALSMAALGTTLWAQQSEDPPPAEGTVLRDAAASDPLNGLPLGEQVDGPNDLARAAAGSLPSLPSFNTNPNEPQPARPNSARASSPNSGSTSNRTTGSAKAVGGPARPPRPDLDAGHSYGLQPYPNATYATPPTARYPVPGGTPYFGQAQAPYYIPVSPEEQRSAQEFRDTVQALRQAKTDEEKAEVRTKLNDLVSKQIDQDLAEREKRLTELETKAKQLRDQLQQRKQTKAEIQKMLVMLIENPQGGLGLPPAWMDAITEPGSQFPVYRNPQPSVVYPSGPNTYIPNYNPN